MIKELNSMLPAVYSHTVRTRRMRTLALFFGKMPLFIHFFYASDSDTEKQFAYRAVSRSFLSM